jgi:hypothetical protein
VFIPLACKWGRIFILDNAGMSRHSLAQSERKLKVQGENALMSLSGLSRLSGFRDLLGLFETLLVAKQIDD